MFEIIIGATTVIILTNTPAANRVLVTDLPEILESILFVARDIRISIIISSNSDFIFSFKSLNLSCICCSSLLFKDFTTASLLHAFPAFSSS